MSETGGAVEGLSNTLGLDGAGTASTNGAAAGLKLPFGQGGGYVKYAACSCQPLTCRSKGGYAGASLDTPLGDGQLSGHLRERAPQNGDAQLNGGALGQVVGHLNPSGVYGGGSTVRPKL